MCVRTKLSASDAEWRGGVKEATSLKRGVLIYIDIVLIYRVLKLELRRAEKSEGLQKPSGQKTSWHLGYTYATK